MKTVFCPRCVRDVPADELVEHFKIIHHYNKRDAKREAKRLGVK